MTVDTDFRVDTRPYSGYEDPGLPIASYIASGSSTGNGTGGNHLLSFLFQVAESDIVTERYNLEQFHIDIGVAASLIAIMSAQGMDHLAFPFRIAARQRWSLIVGSDGVADAAGAITEMSALPIWLGMPQPEVDAGIRFQIPNVDLQVVTASIQGYIWGPRSILAPGGPKRPPDGYFR